MLVANDFVDTMPLPVLYTFDDVLDPWLVTMLLECSVCLVKFLIVIDVSFGRVNPLFVRAENAYDGNKCDIIGDDVIMLDVIVDDVMSDVIGSGVMDDGVTSDDVVDGNTISSDVIRDGICGDDVINVVTVILVDDIIFLDMEMM